MLNLPPIIARIRALIDEDTESSVTYAALEARLALEKVVYDRLRQRHDYISSEQLRAWKPGEVVNRLLDEVDERMTDTMVLSISRHPHVPGEEVAEEDWVKVGTEIGFDAKKLAKLWQALSGLALHVRLPKDKDDHIPPYGDKDRTRRKVEQVVALLEQLSRSTMSTSGFPVRGEVSFDCSCGQKNKRRAHMLRLGQHIYCINPKCKETWKVTEIEGEEASFEIVSIDVPCRVCGALQHIPWRVVTGMKYDQYLTFACSECEGTNFVKWHLMQATLPGSDGAEPTA